MGDMADYCIDNFLDEWENDEFYTYPRKLDRGPGKCPKCKSDTVLRNGKYGEFYGCTTFPKCKGSRCLR